ncbi:uncharacterized protein B0T15DRAFT_270753 [Chaetomium strumarium]|uniref:Uncharacterized protein n=1 Tax=Chaetomium strumarium TaxID=1170767 RepID=A0AAJ0GNP5_9PEZI|nr:hypothetical protein B0T15DRAFT_270753 [Chaetomium strumarium]
MQTALRSCSFFRKAAALNPVIQAATTTSLLSGWSRCCSADASGPRHRWSRVVAARPRRFNWHLHYLHSDTGIETATMRLFRGTTPPTFIC